MLNVEVVVSQSGLGSLVLGKDFVKFAHFRFEQFAAEFKLSNFLGVLNDTVVQTEFLRLKNGSLGLDLVALSGGLHLIGLFIDEFGLVLNPKLLDVDDLYLEFISLFLHVAQLVLKRTSVLIVLASFASEIGKFSVELINLKLLLSDINLVSLFGLFLIFDLLLFGGTLLLKLIELTLEEVILLLGVQVIDLDTRDLIVKVLNLNFLLGDVLVLVLCLLKEVSRTLLNGFLLTGVVDDVITDSFSLTMEHHDRLGKDSLFTLYFFLSKGEVLHLGVSVVERALEKDKLFVKPLLLGFFAHVALLYRFDVFAQS